MNETPKGTDTEPTHEQLVELYHNVIAVCKALGCPDHLIQQHKPSTLFNSMCLIIASKVNLMKVERN